MHSYKSSCVSRHPIYQEIPRDLYVFLLKINFLVVEPCFFFKLEDDHFVQFGFESVGLPYSPQLRVKIAQRANPSVCPSVRTNKINGWGRTSL